MADSAATEGRTEGHVLFGQLLRSPYEAFLVKVHADLAAAGFADSSPAWGTNVFHYLRGGGLRLTELAKRAHTTKQAMRYTVNQLEAAGYVERVPDPADGRAKIICLTERGWALRRAGDQIIDSVYEECVRRLGERRMRQFEDLMTDVSSVLEENREHG